MQLASDILIVVWWVASSSHSLHVKVNYNSSQESFLYSTHIMIRAVPSSWAAWHVVENTVCCILLPSAEQNCTQQSAALSFTGLYHHVIHESSFVKVIIKLMSTDIWSVLITSSGFWGMFISLNLGCIALQTTTELWS